VARVKRRHISTRKHDVIPENTNPHSDSRGIEKPRSFFVFFLFHFFFPLVFLVFYFSCFLSTHTSLSVFLLLSIYFFLPLYSCFVIPLPFLPPTLFCLFACYICRLLTRAFLYVDFNKQLP
jgi:hypothetical protein